MKTNKKTPIEKKETIFEAQKRLRLDAIELSKNFKDVKPIKYLLKN